MNVAAVKAEVFRVLAQLPELGGVQVLYDLDEANGQFDNEVIHGGDATGPIAPLAFRGGGRMPRRQDATINLHVKVQTPGGKVADAEARVEQLATIVSDYLAANPTLSDVVPGLKSIGAVQFDLRGDFDDAGGIAVCTLQLACISILT